MGQKVRLPGSEARSPGIQDKADEIFGIDPGVPMQRSRDSPAASKQPLPMQEDSKEIHKNLRESVKLYTYWVRNIETYMRKSQELFKLEKAVQNLRQLLAERSTNFEREPRVGTSVGDPEQLPNWIKRFSKGTIRSVAIRKVFEILRDEKNNASTDLCLDDSSDDPEKTKKNEPIQLCLEDFGDIPEKTITEIFDRIRPQTVITESEKGNNTRRPSNTSRVTERTFNGSVDDLISAIKFYQLTIKDDDDLEQELNLKKEKIDEIEDVMTQIEELKFDDSHPSQTKSKKVDSTNFVAAEMGFLTEVQAEGNEERSTKYYHYPVTFSNKNTFSIYDLQNEEFNYFLFKEGKIGHNNYIVDDVLVKHAVNGEGRSEADPSNDYHSESVLFFLCEQRAFQTKLISKLIKDLKKEDLKLTKLERLILEIHSSNDICDQCFQKAEYLMNWEEENETLEKNNQGNHFLKYFKNTFAKMLEKKKVLGRNSEIKLEVEIRFSYDKAYCRVSKSSHHRFHRIPVNDDSIENSQFSATLDSGRALSNYSIITSGGVAKSHNNYCYAYNKAVQPTRIRAMNRIKKAWREYKRTSNHG